MDDQAITNRSQCRLDRHHLATRQRKSIEQPEVEMIYEFRSYEAAPGRLQDLNRRFQELTWPLFERHGFRQVGFWIPEDSSRLVYVLQWQDREEKTAKWEAFMADPEWQRGRAASETCGPLILKVDTEFWSPTEYSAAT
jgi:heme-degrading monooxygenase HmoA